MGILDALKDWFAKQVPVDKPVANSVIVEPQPAPIVPLPPPVVKPVERDYKKVNPLVIDISHHNTISSFDAIKSAGIVGVIIKASQGKGYVDKKFEGNRKACLDRGLLVGCYHFGDASDVRAQAGNFLRVVKFDGTQRLILDFETNPGAGGTMSLAQAKQWLQIVHEATGQRPVFYSYSAMLKEKLGKKKDDFLALHKLWIAQYGPKAVIPPTWDNYWLWQFTDGKNGPLPHAISGVVGAVDINSYPGTKEELAKEWVA